MGVSKETGEVASAYSLKRGIALQPIEPHALLLLRNNATWGLPMNRLALASAACLLAMSASAHAATNLVANSGFESGDFSGWNLSGPASDGYPAAVITYGSATAYPTGAYGEAVPQESTASGAYGAYFVSDFADETLTQSLTLSGKYNVGFSYYAPLNGSANAGDATLTAFLGSSYKTIDVGSLTAGEWYDFSTTLSFAPGTTALGGFEFVANGAPSKDIVIDNAFVTSAVPEPSTWIMLLAGVAMIGAALRLGRRRGFGSLLAH
jgi:hypothetical protein